MSARLPMLALALALSWMGAAQGLARDLHVTPDAAETAGDGSAQAPFATLDAALRKATGGDRIVLGDGAYGKIAIKGVRFDPPVRIEAEAPGGAHATGIFVRKSRGLHFAGLSVWPDGPHEDSITLVVVKGDSADIRLDSMDLRGSADAPDSYLDWTKEQWLSSLRANGARLDGPDNAITNSRLTGVAFGITTTGPRAMVTGNRIEGFSGDAMRGLGDGSVFAGNMAQNTFKVDRNHDDGFQSWATKKDADGRKVVSDITIENNIILEWTGPQKHPLRGKLQGLGLFDGEYRNFTIRNNLIAISAYHGIALYNGSNSRIVNNTVVHISGGPADFPWIGLFKTRDGAAETRVSNNVAMSYKGISKATRRNAVTRYPARMFRDPAKLDFRLMPGSPLVDAGTSEEAPPTDIAGTPRGARPDLGAFELN
jgi:parallel beta-helix repeat protein|tara:strand:+ start:224 stop:1501 length:1278 start_codon:yes stop_codon:yes gene_type:complete